MTGAGIDREVERPGAGAQLGPLPPVGRHTLVVIDSVAHRLRRARWMVRPDTP